MTSAKLCTTPLSDRAPLRNFTLPNFPPCFCHPSGIEITSKSSRLVLHGHHSPFPCPVSQRPPRVGFSHVSRGEKEVLGKETRRDCPTLQNWGSARPIPSLARTRSPSDSTSRLPGLWIRVLDRKTRVSRGGTHLLHSPLWDPARAAGVPQRYSRQVFPVDKCSLLIHPCRRGNAAAFQPPAIHARTPPGAGWSY